ncbi:MAG: hypothetical protein HRU18_00915 [Pseudoalteromonas sp.]|uniref:hypothetical protein n=1 Tax=Pseudoalteromonas sp. TaxID=53249 RepID=UPI001E017890|nr:hypothetical protein [Pseudoalteromonas sp.]NRA76741.1 hypothetical protein [Pseudoalteromonas sp.]
MANGQFQTADIVGNLRQGQQFAVNLDQQQALAKRQAELAPLKLQSTRLGVQQQQNVISDRTDKQKNQSLFSTALRVDSASDADIIPILEASIARVQGLGGDAKESMAALELAKGGDFDTVRRGAKNLIDIGVRQGDIKPKGGTQSAEGKSFNQLIADFSDADKVKAKRRRAGLDARAVGSAVQTISESGQVVNIANVEKALTEAKEIGKLTAQQKLKPVVEAAVISAVGQAKAEVAKLGEERSSVKTLAIYNNSMSNLTKALDNTITGPFIGLTPALTANAQIADGAIAMMLPLMKDVFRGAGEGTFTEGDQKILTDMIPTRSDGAEARRTKIMFIDELIRARLTTAPVAEAQPSGLSEAEQAELQQLRAEFGGQ